MLRKYQLPQCLEFYSKYPFPDIKSKHTANIAISYYYLAYFQMLSLGDAYTTFFKEENPDQDEVMFHLRKSWSYAFGMYAMLRTTIEALNIMKKMLKYTIAVDDYQGEIKRIIDIVNNIVKHPTYKHGVVSEACEPKALSMNGEIDIIFWSDSGHSSKIELDPMKDFDIIHNYLEFIANRFLNVGMS